MGLGNPLDDAARGMVREQIDPNTAIPGARRDYHERARFMDLMVIAAKRDTIFEPLIKLWSSLNGTIRANYAIDEIVWACELDPAKVIAAASGIAYELGFGAGSLMAMTNLPEVVKASLESAQMPGKEGVRDRELIMRHAMFVPIPEGQTINIQNIASAKAGSGFESFEEAMKRADEAARTTVIDVE